jgi:hypothetical protein
MEDRENGQEPECRCRVTATIKADTTYELEVIKARLVRAGANILRIDPSPKSLLTHQNMRLRPGAYL